MRGISYGRKALPKRRKRRDILNRIFRLTFLLVAFSIFFLFKVINFILNRKYTFRIGGLLRSTLFTVLYRSRGDSSWRIYGIKFSYVALGDNFRIFVFVLKF